MVCYNYNWDMRKSICSHMNLVSGSNYGSVIDENVVLPEGESVVKGFSHVPSTQLHEYDIDFTVATYLAAVEDDESEDAIWESYLK